MFPVRTPPRDLCRTALGLWATGRSNRSRLGRRTDSGTFCTQTSCKATAKISSAPSSPRPNSTSHAAAAESLPRKAKPVADHTSCPGIATTATYVSPPLHDATSRFRPPSPHAPQAAARPGRLQLAAAGRRRTAGRALTDPARARHRSLSIMEPKIPPNACVPRRRACAARRAWPSFAQPSCHQPTCITPARSAA